MDVGYRDAALLAEISAGQRILNTVPCSEVANVIVCPGWLASSAFLTMFPMTRRNRTGSLIQDQVPPTLIKTDFFPQLLLAGGAPALRAREVWVKTSETL